jgi:hypothetical protein
MDEKSQVTRIVRGNSDTSRIGWPTLLSSLTLSSCTFKKQQNCARHVFHCEAEPHPLFLSKAMLSLDLGGFLEEEWVPGEMSGIQHLTLGPRGYQKFAVKVGYGWRREAVRCHSDLVIMLPCLRRAQGSANSLLAR